MSDNKPKVPATGMLEISISGGENLQGHLVGQLVFDKDNPFAAEILQATSAPAVISIKDSRHSSLEKQFSEESVDDNEEDTEEITENCDEQCSSPRTSVLISKANDENEKESSKRFTKPSPFQVLSHSSGAVHCNSCPECLRGGCDNRDDYFPTVSTSGPESACIWQNLPHGNNTPSSGKKERMAAGGTHDKPDDSGFIENVSSNSIPNNQSMEYRSKPSNEFFYNQERPPIYQDTTHNIVFKEDAKVDHRPVTPLRQGHNQPYGQRCTAGGSGAYCTRQCCNNGRVDLGDHATNICSLVKDMNCRMHNVRSALCCSVAENVHYTRDNAYQQLCIVDNCEQHNVNQMERLLLEQRTAVPCCGNPVTDEVFSQNLRQQCIDQTPTGCGEVRESDDVSFRRRSLPLDCCPCVTDCSPSKILRFASGRDDMVGEEMYSQHTKHHSLGRCCTGDCYERRECEERDLMRRAGCPDGLPCPIKCIQPCDSCPPPAGNPALESQQPTEYSGNWDCRFNSEEIFGHHKQLYNVEQGACKYSEVNDDQKEYKRASRPADYVCLQQSLCTLQALDNCAGRTCGGRDSGDAECFQQSKSRSMSRSPCGNRNLTESEMRHDRRLYGAPTNLCKPQPPQNHNHMRAGRNPPTPGHGNLEYTHHSKVRSIDSNPEGQIDLVEKEHCTEQIQQVPSCKLAAGGDRNHVCTPCCSSTGISEDYNQFVHTRSIDRTPTGTIDLLEHEQKEYSQNIPPGGTPCPVAIPGPFGGPGRIPQSTDILDISKINYPNAGAENGEFVSIPRLSGRGNPPSTVSNQAKHGGSRGDEDYLQHYVIRSVDKNETGAVDVVEQEQRDLVHSISPARQLPKQTNQCRLAASGSSRDSNPCGMTQTPCGAEQTNNSGNGSSGSILNISQMSGLSEEGILTERELQDLFRNGIRADSKEEYVQHSKKRTVDKDGMGAIDVVESEQNDVFQVIPSQNAEQDAQSQQLSQPTYTGVRMPALRGSDLLDISQMSGLSGEGLLTEEELNRLHRQSQPPLSPTRRDRTSDSSLGILDPCQMTGLSGEGILTEEELNRHLRRGAGPRTRQPIASTPARPDRTSDQSSLGILDISNISGLSGEGLLTTEELEQLNQPPGPEEYIQHSKSRTVDKQSCGALDVREQETKDTVQVIPAGLTLTPYNPFSQDTPSNELTPFSQISGLRSPDASFSPNSTRQTAGLCSSPARTPCPSPAAAPCPSPAVAEPDSESFLQRSKMRTVDKSVCGDLDHTDKEQDKVQYTESSWHESRSPSVQLACPPAPSPSQSLHSQPPTSCSQGYPYPSFPRVPMSSRQPRLILPPTNKAQTYSQSSTTPSFDPREMTFGRMSEIEGTVGSFPYHDERSGSDFDSSAISCSIGPQQARWDRNISSALTAGGDLCYSDKYLPNGKPSYDSLQEKYPGSGVNTKSYLPANYYGMQHERLEEYPPNKYCRINEGSYSVHPDGQMRLYPSRNLPYTNPFITDGPYNAGRYGWNDAYPQYCNPEFYGDSFVANTGRQRAGADNPTKMQDRELNNPLSGGCCTARALHQAQFGSKCNAETNADQKVDDLELKLKQSLSSGHEICQKCLSSSSIQKTKCCCGGAHSEMGQNDLLIPKCSCHQLYQSANCEANIQENCNSCRNSLNCDSLRAGMDPRCKPPPKPPTRSSNSAKPEGHEFTQHFKYRHVDKDACGTYDVIELDTAENLTKMLGAGGTNGDQPPPGSSDQRGGVSNDLDHVVHLKYRNVDKSCCGEFDIQEGEQIDIRKIILPGQCNMRGGMDVGDQPQPGCQNKDDDDECTKRLRSGMDNGQKYKLSSDDSGYYTDCFCNSYDVLSMNFYETSSFLPDPFHSEELINRMDSFQFLKSPKKKSCNRLRAGMDRGNGGNENGGDQEFKQKFKYRFADKTACGTYDLVEMETLEDLRLLGPSKPPPPPPQRRSPVPEQHSFSRSRAGMEKSDELCNEKVNRKTDDTPISKSYSSLKTEHLRAGMDFIIPESFKSRSLDSKKQNYLDVIAYNSVENIPGNTVSDINAFGDTKTNCIKIQSSSMLTTGYSSKYKDELHTYDSSIMEKPCKKSSEVTNLRAGMDCKSKPPPPAPPKDEFSQFTKYRFVDKTPCGTYDVHELEALEDLSLTKSAASKQTPCGKAQICPSSGKETNDLDYYVHRKYRNVDKNCIGDLDVQEGEQRDIRLLTLGCQETTQPQPRPVCPKPETKTKCNPNNKERHTCASPRPQPQPPVRCISPRPQPPPRCISPCPVSHCQHASCSTSPRSSPCPSPCHSPTSSICSGHHREKKHCKSDVLSSFREYTNSSCDYSPNDADSDSKTSEISDLLKQEIRRLRKLNEEALAMISAHRCSTQQNLSKQPLICEGGRTVSNYCNARSSSSGGKNLHLYINRLVNECASDVNDTVRKKIIEGVLEFVRSNSDWLKLNFPKDSGDENDGPRSKAVNFQVSGTFKYNKDKEGSKEQDMTITSMQIMSGCNDYKPGTGSTSKEASSPTKEPEEPEKSKEEEE